MTLKAKIIRALQEQRALGYTDEHTADRILNAVNGVEGDPEGRPGLPGHGVPIREPCDPLGIREVAEFLLSADAGET